MEQYSVYEDIASRTNGDIYVGVVGPVRTGKSTFIKRFMEKLVIPTAEPSQKKIMRDELPQPAAGRTVMTTEPKFVPAKAAPIKIGNVSASVRLVDCVGYAVEGANGFEEDGAPRLVKTPWSETPLPFEDAASLGTEKVIKEHSTIGVLVTTDGSITEIPRSSYEEAEERAASELKAIGKPFVVLLNCVEPSKNEELRLSLEEKYGAPTVAVNAEKLTEKEIAEILKKVLFEFPLTEININIPEWAQSLPEDGKILSSTIEKLKKIAPSLVKMKDLSKMETAFDGDEYFTADGVEVDLGKGKAVMSLAVKDGVFYSVISEESGENIQSDSDLMRYVKAAASAKRSYDKIKDAFSCAEEYGYGMVAPEADGMKLEMPKLTKKGSGYGVHFKASAPSYHIIKVDVTGEVNPIVGTQKQGEEFARETIESYESGSDKIWETNIFGKSLKELLSDGLFKKTDAIPAEVRKKMRRTITRIVNEGKGGVICILL